MADKNIQITVRNPANTDWDELYPVTKAENILGVGEANGIASLDATGKVPSAQLPTFAAPVTSVAGKTGVVTLAKTDVGLGNVDNAKQVNAVATTIDVDPNTTLVPYILTSHANSPEGSGKYFHIHTYFYSTLTTSSGRSQLALPYHIGNSSYVRYYFSGTWTPWYKLLNNANNLSDLSNVATARTNLGVVQTRISGGKFQYYTGSAWADVGGGSVVKSYQTGEVAGLNVTNISGDLNGVFGLGNQVTISAVNQNKCMCWFVGGAAGTPTRAGQMTNIDAPVAVVTPYLSNGTTLLLRTNYNTAYISGRWYVIEFL